MYSFIRFIFFTVTIFTLTAFQDDNDFQEMENVKTFKKGVLSMSERTNTIDAEFTQQKHLSILSNTINSSGTLKFKKPNLLRWEYNKPFSYIVVLNGEEIQINDEGNVNTFEITSSRSFQKINELIINSVSGNILDEEQFELEYLENKDLYLVKMKPREDSLKSFINQINVYFNKDNFTVNKLRLIESEGDYTSLDFTNQELNEDIPNTAFQLN